MVFQFCTLVLNCTGMLFRKSYFFENYVWCSMVGGSVASWLVRSTPEQVVQVRALAGDIVYCCVLG